MKKLSAIVFAAALMLSVTGAEVPEQFSAWGSSAGEQAPLPSGWKEVPPPADDLNVPQDFPSAAEKERGCAVFARHPFDPIYPGSYPTLDDLAELRTFAYLGQYVPLSLGVRALKNLSSVTLSVSDLSSEQGDKIAASQIDIRVVRCERVTAKAGTKTFYWLPISLEKPVITDIPADRTQGFWVTVYVAPEVKPGEYSGKATLTSGTAAFAEIPIRLKVLPLRLKRAPQTYCMWQAPSLDEFYGKVSTDLWEHGMNASWPGATGAASRDDANKNRVLPEDQLAEMRAGGEKTAEFYKKTKFAQHPRPSYGGPNTNYVTWSWDTTKNWFGNWPLNAHLDSNVCKLVQMVEDIRKEKGLPEVLYYLCDEPGGHPETFSFAQHYYKLVKEKFPHLRTFCTIGGGLAVGLDEINQLASVVDVFATNRISERVIQDLRKNNKEFHIYNGGTTGNGAPGKDRLFFGFYAWKTTATGIGQWVHCRGKNSAGAVRNPDENGYVAPSPDGPVPTIHWEAVRAGVDDMRYIVTLHDAIAQARKSADAAAQKQAAAAEELLTSIEAMLPIPRDELGNHAEMAQKLAARTYEKWRWRAAEQILKLNALLGLKEGKEEEIPLPKREYKYSAAAVDVRANEVKLVEQDFENGIAGWNVQAWSGKGSGGLTEAERHSGKSAVSLTNTGDGDVLVCTAPAKLALKKGKTYSFSAWIKSQDVMLGAKLKIAGQETRESLGVGGTSDWRQVSCEYTPKKDETAKYLAVWLQGKGTAYVDDVGIVEFDAPAVEPVEVVLADPLVDADDRAVALKLRAENPDVAQSIKISISGQRPHEVSLKPQATTIYTFSAVELTPGEHTISIDWPNGGKKLGLQRIKGPFEK